MARYPTCALNGQHLEAAVAIANSRCAESGHSYSCFNESVTVARMNDLYFPKGNENGDYYEPYWRATFEGSRKYGPSREVASKRCWVALVLGEEVELPDEPLS